MSDSVEESYAFCREVARKRAKNFYYAFALLEKPRRDAMCALYAFNRVCDDISDEPEEHGYESAAGAIEVWRGQLESTLRGQPADHPCWPAFRDAVERYEIPHQHFHDMITGVSSDLERTEIATFDELYEYCYQVASAVGLSVIHVFGFESDEALPMAERCGIAFQLTNILRDVREDAEMGRVYLPGEDLERFGVDPAQFLEGRMTEEFRRLMQFEAERARGYYRDSADLVSLVEPASRGAMWTLIRIYGRLLERIEKNEFDVLSRRVSVPRWEKGLIFLRGMLGGASMRSAPIGA
jgi:15-cis-phytoene synthase